MDPVTGFQLAAPVVTFVEVGLKLFQIIKQVQKSANGASEENSARMAVNRSMDTITEIMGATDESKIPIEERPLYELAKECKRVSEQMAHVLERITVKRSDSRFAVLSSALKALWYESKLGELETRLNKCRSQIDTHKLYRFE